MSERRELERLLRSHLDRAANPAPRPGQLAEVMAAVADQRQRPRLLAAISSDGRLGLGAAHRSGSGAAAAVAVVLAATLLALAVLGLLAGGRRELADVPTPPVSSPAAVAVTSPTPSPGPTATPAFSGPPACDPNLPTTSSLQEAIGTTPTSPTPVTAGGIAAFVAGPDGRFDIRLVDPKTGGQSVLVPLGITLNKDHSLAWSPDGSALVIGISGDCGHGMLTWADGRLSRLVPDGQPAGTQFNEDSSVWSPDGSRLALALLAHDGPGEPIWILSRDGAPTQTFPPSCPLCSEFWLAWTPDGTRLGGAHENLTNDQLSASEIGVAFLDPATGTWTTGHEPGGLSVLGWRTNDELLIANGKDQVVAFNATDGSRRVLPIDGTGAVLLLPGGRQVVTDTFLGSGPAMHSVIGLLDLASGDRRTLYTSDKGVTLGGGILAPDGSAVAFTVDDDTGATHSVVVMVDGSGSHDLPGVDVSTGAWQPIPQP